MPVNTETVKLTGGKHDGRWHKVELGATTVDVDGVTYVKGDFGRWSAKPAKAAPKTAAE